MSFTRWVVQHPVAVWMITLAVLVFGFVGYAQLPLDLMPDISYPTLTVRTEVPGAAPEEVEGQVSRPIEEALSTVEGLVAVESRSRAGISDVVLEFDWGTPMSAASQDVRERLQTTMLPTGTGRPLLLRYDPSLDPILRVAVSASKPSEDTTATTTAAAAPVDLLALRELAERTLKRDLEALDGVAAVSVRGGLSRLVRVEPREDLLAARGVTLAQLSGVLASENVNLAGGIVREGENEYLVRTLNELGDLDEVRELAIVRADGARVRVGDVATVTEGAADREVLARLDGAEAVELEVYKEADANIVTVATAVKGALEGMATEGVAHAVLDDQASFVENALDNLVRDGAIGALLAVLVTFVFLRDWTATAIIGSAIPICLVATFAVMYVGGVSLNLMSLGGLALGVSMVIDSATVVLENIQNKLDAGESREDAAVHGTSEVAGAVFASVLTGMAVFFPIVFVEGIAGQIFGDLAMAVVFSLLASLAVALLFVPMLAARGWGVHEEAPPERARDIPATRLRACWERLRASEGRRWWGWPWALLRFAIEGLAALVALGFALVTAWGVRLPWVAVRTLARVANRWSLAGADRFLTVYGRAEGVFGRGLARALARPGTVLLGAAASLALAFVLLKSAGAELLPEVRQGRFTVDLAMPVGTPLTRTDAVVGQVERAVAAMPGVATVYTVVGTERRADAKPEEGEHTARMLVQLDEDADEDVLIGRIRAEALGWPRLSANVRRPALFSFRTPLEVVIHGNELEVLEQASARGTTALAAVDGLVDVRSSLGKGYPEIRVGYQREKLASLGLSIGDVARAVRTKVQGETPTRLSRGERRVDMLVRLDARDRDSREALARINVNPRLVPPIPLDAVATLVEGEGPSEIRRVDQQRAVVLTAGVEGFDLAGAGERAAEALRAAGLPDGVTWEIAGQQRELQRGLASLGGALAMAVFLVYVIMASTFESVRGPFVILFSVPLAAVGVALGLFVTGTPVSVTVFIGLIVLAGVVVANAIVLVDAIQRLRAEGRPLDAAIQEAAALRLRPILITALNSVIGLVPLALGLGEGAELQRPMAITIIWGLASSTVLTLVVVPVVYRWVGEGRTAS